MNGLGAGPRSAIDRRRRGVLLAAGGVGLAVVLVAVTVWSSRPPSDLSPTPSSSQNPTTGLTSPAPANTLDATEPWGELAVFPLQQVAMLTATKASRAGVAADTAFTLASIGADDPKALARAIEVTPAVEFAITAGPVDRTVTLRPTGALIPGQLYRFTLRAPDGTTAGSWAFQAQSPLRVATTLPYDGATDVPVTTGIELTFDQDGTVDAASHFSIDPVVKGRFEQHGRSFVFVPERLKLATLYTVTLARGVRVEGSSEALEEDVVVRFETAPPARASQPSVSVTYQFATTMEWRPGDPPIISVGISASAPTHDEQLALRERRFPVTVYRLPSERAGLDGIRTLTEPPDWTIWSRPTISTAGLTRVLSFDAEPQSDTDWGGSWFRFPAPLELGWYLVEGPQAVGRGGQMVLQVTDIAAYVAVAKNRLLVWTNDISTGGPLEGATVEMFGGAAIGPTDSNGLLVATTPSAIQDATTNPGTLGARPILAIRATGGRSLVIPVGLSGQVSWGDPEDVHDRVWSFMATDRETYRQTDTVNVWGYVRERDTGRVPQNLELRLMSGWGYGRTDDPPPISSVAVRPSASGAFSESMKFSDLPYGHYGLQLWSGSDQVAESWFSVAQIRKPAYQLAVETDRHVLLAGDRVTLTAMATFFDGTSVPGVRLTANLFGEQQIATDRTGVATATARATTRNDGWYEDWSCPSAAPTQGEEGEISGSTCLRVFPASVRLDGEGKIEAGRVTVTGSLHEVAVERLEQAWGQEAEDSVDPNGPAVVGAEVTAEVIELVPVRERTRQIYDFIAKQVIDQYEYRIDQVARGTQTLTTGPDGAFRLSVPATADRNYEVLLSTTDPQGRTTRLRVFASDPWVMPPIWSLRPRLVRSCGPENERGSTSASLAIGDRLCLAARDDRGDLPSGGSNHYLFYTAQRGLRDVVVSGTPAYEAHFTAADVPNLAVTGVRFTGEAMIPIGSFHASFDTAERELTIALATDRERYAPGETVTLDVRTTDRAARPVSASVVLRAVDEKLFAVGAAYDENPLWGLYRWVGTWMLWTHASHPLPPSGSEGGDTSGGDGDGRAVFVDSLLFTQVTTNAQGRAQVSFKLSDDLTSWHVSAAAMTSVPEAGSGFILIPVGLPFFIEATMAPEYLVTDEPIFRVRAFGSGLREGDPVVFTVTSASLGMTRTTVRGAAFEDIAVPLPKLSLGAHAITIAAASGSGAAALSDRLTRRFTVIESRLVETRTTYAVLTEGVATEGGPGFTTYTFSDAGRGRYVPLLQALARSGGPRVDQALAAAIARELLVEGFGVDPDTLPLATFDPGTYQSSGIALLPYSSTDLGLSVRVALLAGDRFDRAELASALDEAALYDTASTREQRVLAFAGLAGLGEPVLAVLQAFAADPALTIRERLYVGLGLAALGDGAAALAIERDLLSTHGEQRGPWIRLRVGQSLDDTVEATSLLALLAAALGDPLANDAEGYVDANPAVDELHGLQQVAFITRMLERTPSAAGRFAYTIAGERTVVDLDPGESFSLRLVESQRRTLSLEPLAGQVGLATSWQVPLRRESVARDANLELVRTYLPSPTVPGDAMVEVRLTATFGPQVVAGCHEVSDLTPSGLVPMDYYQDWPYSDSPAPSYVSPHRIEGQRVSFCVGPSTESRTINMRYFARIVTAGTYTWEPAVIQSTRAAESINLTTSRELTIR